MRYLRVGAVLLFIVSLALNLMGNARYKARQDTTRPVIESSIDHLQLTVEEGTASLKQGLTAHDKEDGDLTENILVASTSYFVEKGTINANYVVFDGGHNSASYTRKVTFTNYESPRFSLDQPLIFYQGQNIRYLNYIRASDCLDGDLTGQIKVVKANVSNYTVGIYPMLLEVSNSFGDRAQVELTLVVKSVSSRAPEIFLKNYIVYLKAGQSFDPHSLVQSVRAFGTGESLPVSEVTVLGSVDTDTPGCYQLAYSYTQDGHEGRAYLSVVVEGD